MSVVGFKRPRVTNDRHLDFIRSLPCACCGNDIQTEAAHLRTGDLYYGKRNTGFGEKPDDKWTLPLCWEHHGEQHKGNELQFWKRHGINPFVLAMSLYSCTGDHVVGTSVLRQQAPRAS